MLTCEQLARVASSNLGVDVQEKFGPIIPYPQDLISLFPLGMVSSTYSFVKLAYDLFYFRFDQTNQQEAKRVFPKQFSFSYKYLTTCSFNIMALDEVKSLGHFKVNR
jgi:hypothetical protein